MASIWHGPIAPRSSGQTFSEGEAAADDGAGGGGDGGVQRIDVVREVEGHARSEAGDGLAHYL